jgi:hypothetical protein
MDCVFCGDEAKGNKLSSEHVIPKWLQVRLGMEKEPMLSILQNVVTREQTVEFPLTLNTFVAKRVCRTCNSDWMGALEGRMREILEPTLRGERAVGDLTTADQQVFLRWMWKSALALFAAKQFRFVSPPQEHYRLVKGGNDLPNGLHCIAGISQSRRVGAAILPGPLLLPDYRGELLVEEHLRGILFGDLSPRLCRPDARLLPCP